MIVPVYAPDHITLSIYDRSEGGAHFPMIAWVQGYEPAWKKPVIEMIHK